MSLEPYIGFHKENYLENMSWIPTDLEVLEIQVTMFSKI